MTAPAEVLLAVLRYDVVPGSAARVPEVYPRHRVSSCRPCSSGPRSTSRRRPAMARRPR